MQNPEIVTVLAALIAGAISLVATTLSKEQKISEFRQAWIDGLRSELAAFLSSSRAFARSMEALHSEGQKESPFSKEKVSELRLITAESVYRIKLRLNPKETAHIELLRLLKKAISEQNEGVSEKNKDANGVLTTIDELSDQAGLVLKAEWKRVKNGEFPFRITRYVSCVVIAGASYAFWKLL